MGNKNRSNISIIGGADGPTSVFLLGGSGKRPLKDRIKNYFYKKKRKRMAKKIVPGAHSLEEVVSYVKKEYGATEIPKTHYRYIEQRKCLKESLIIQYRPELLGNMREIEPPEVLTEETAKQMLKQVQRRSEFIETFSDEEMPMDYHVYEICSDEGRMEVDIDFKWDVFGCSYSGSKKEMKHLRHICREIYIYYGVTEEDIQNNTKRYSSLLTTLSSD